MSDVIEPTRGITLPSVRQGSITVSDTSGQSSIFPVGYQLVVTTTHNVYVWGVHGVTGLFHAGSGGIVAAKKLAHGSDMLAVADSHLVVLHDVKKGSQRSYRLKGSEGKVRLLKYSCNESQTLFFTTNLHNSVQAFSLKDSKLLDPHDTHPSPPAVFALSCDSRLLLSTSLEPPTIRLRNIATNTPSVHLRPTCSSSAVVAANFHPERQGVFLLAFSDGSIAVYDASQILRRNGVARHNSGIPVAAGEVASVKRLHTPTTKTLSEVDLVVKADESAIRSPSVTAHVAGVSSVALLPGHRAMAVTVGSDGKCCVVDFSQPNRRKAVLLRSWHLRRPATCLSVIYSRAPRIASQQDGADDPMIPSNKDYCIAVGGKDGKVLLFDLDGTLLGHRVLDPARSRIVDVEWAKTEIDHALSGRRESEADNQASSKAAPAEDRRISEHRARAGSAPPQPSDEALFDFSNTRKSYRETPLVTAARDRAATQAAADRKGRGADDSQLPLFFTPRPPQTLDVKLDNSTFMFEVPPLFDKDTTKTDQAVRPQAPVNPASHIQPKESTTPDSTALPSTSQSGSMTPPIPPRPRAKPGGRYHMRRALKALEAAGHEVPQMKERKISRNTTRSNRHVSAATLPKTRAIIAPRPPRKPSRMCSSPAAILKDPARPPMVHPSTASAQAPEPLTPLPNGFATPPASVYQTAATHQSSMDTSPNSSDTVVDWDTGLPRQAVPTLHQPTYQPSLSKVPKKNKSKGKRKEGKKENHKKVHVSLSVSSQDGQTTSPGVDPHASSRDTICHWPHYHNHPDHALTTPSTEPSPLEIEIKDAALADQGKGGTQGPSQKDSINSVDNATALILRDYISTAASSPERQHSSPLRPRTIPVSADQLKGEAGEREAAAAAVKVGEKAKEARGLSYAIAADGSKIVRVPGPSTAAPVMKAENEKPGQRADQGGAATKAVDLIRCNCAEELRGYLAQEFEVLRQEIRDAFAKQRVLVRDIVADTAGVGGVMKSHVEKGQGQADAVKEVQKMKADARVHR